MRILILAIILIICAHDFSFASNAHLQSESICAHQPAKKNFIQKEREFSDLSQA
jgi:hypothetical protein